jgi:hypothetical protein
MVIGQELALSYADREGPDRPAVPYWLSRPLRPLGEVIMNLKTVIIWVVVIFVIYYLATDPTGAAHFMRTALDGLRSAGHSLSTFVSNL